jgi:molybdopterin-containing oxidoreductase family iron-sulfur binding subunit
MIACAVENNVAPAHPDATDRTGITWMRVYRVNNGAPYPANRVRFVPMLCQHCGDTPCATVCPQEAVGRDPETGIVDQMPQRCLGCRYCMAACPYHARYFNWWDPVWPAGSEKTLNPPVAPRMRGVVEKCNFCHGRYQAARAKSAAAGRRGVNPADYQPACVEACPVKAIAFGDLADANSAVASQAREPDSFRLLERLGTDSKIYYHSREPWIRQMANQQLVQIRKETPHG